MSNKLWIESHLENSNSQQSFSFQARADEAGCGGILHGDSGNITAPMGNDGKYRNGVRCTWDIEAQNGHRIEINFSGRFDIEQDDGCDNDFIQVRLIFKRELRLLEI